MKLIIFFFINVIFSNAISEWIDLNNHIINSKLYKISFKQRFESIIDGTVHYDIDSCNLIYLNNKIRYESSDKILIINQDSLIMLNKYSNQIFIDNTDTRYNLLLSLNLSDILLDSEEFINSKDGDYYYINDKDAKVKIYFLNKIIIKVEILYNDLMIKLSDIELSIADTNEVINYFQIGNNLSEIFDLRIK